MERLRDDVRLQVLGDQRRFRWPLWFDEGIRPIRTRLAVQLHVWAGSGYADQRLSPFAHGLLGGVTNSSLNFSSPGFPDVLTNPGYTKFAWVIGGGVDAGIGRRWAVRIAQFDFERISLLTRVNGFRFSVGLVLKL